MSVSAKASYRLRYGAPVVGEPPAEWTEVLAQQLAHRSVRRYRADGEVSDETLSALIAAAQSAPTSGNLQLWSVVAVREDARRHRLAALAGEQANPIQSSVAQAPLFLVWLADLARARQVTSKTGSATAEGADFVEAALLSFIDVALAAQNASLAAESLGLGTVFVGAIRNKPLEVAAELGLPPNVFPVFGLTVGHPDRLEETAVKPRLPQEAVLHREQYSLDPAHLETYEDVLNGFYAEAGLPEGWAQRVAHRFGSVAGLKGREHLRAALFDRGFQLR
ncbi:NADPH-dependent oxidoreductase [Kribbella antibiotica]|uniref:NADPH-dependent oxidoreductase n=1 Tax=Kribbella antibiotica TaxID=190195 RepID=A0A4R4ZWA7_9ACTN|nr:NADPH-dependent oxidoreductase [Kribbella antibiotica]TDD63205.1 NADPH-dependent oxidoreductase [Kribbella antibiotica]